MDAIELNVNYLILSHILFLLEKVDSILEFQDILRIDNRSDLMCILKNLKFGIIFSALSFIPLFSTQAAWWEVSGRIGYGAWSPIEESRSDALQKSSASGGLHYGFSGSAGIGSGYSIRTFSNSGKYSFLIDYSSIKESASESNVFLYADSVSNRPVKASTLMNLNRNEFIFEYSYFWIPARFGTGIGLRTVAESTSSDPSFFATLPGAAITLYKTSQSHFGPQLSLYYLQPLADWVQFRSRATVFYLDHGTYNENSSSITNLPGNPIPPDPLTIANDRTTIGSKRRGFDLDLSFIFPIEHNINLFTGYKLTVSEVATNRLTSTGRSLEAGGSFTSFSPTNAISDMAFSPYYSRFVRDTIHTIYFGVTLAVGGEEGRNKWYN
ncbi:hypothetical protein [Leptospira sp. id769339]|uniref:hypothetical protein n=1 Tax=Leptospira sp. id769339 TaxID=2864221 RepID=UPI00214CF58D|nr:hypothetical protein [Leptospira sp. id769339]MCR1795535.1 hypothetical protein [Leptospira sp. id769339]